MSKDRPDPPPQSTPQTLALSTKVEEDFVAPLTSLRGALEILRDVPDLSDDERHRFLNTALLGCARLEQSVEDLAKSVYAAGQQAAPPEPAGLTQERYKSYADRVHLFDELNVIDIDFSDFVFKSAAIVNEFHDVIEHIIDETRRDWYFAVNYRDCSIWPEAWVAFAHRGKRINVSHSLGTVRYASRDDAEGDERTDGRSDGYDPDLFGSREAVFARIEDMKSARTA